MLIAGMSIPPYPEVSFWKVEVRTEVKEQMQYPAIFRCLDKNRLPETSFFFAIPFISSNDFLVSER
jgi:hypothetical protein